MIDEPELPVVGDEPVSQVAVDIMDEVVKHPHFEYLSAPRFGIGRQQLAVAPLLFRDRIVDPESSATPRCRK